MKKTVIYSLAFIALGLTSASLGPTLPALAANNKVEMNQISYLFVARSLGTMIGAWLIGRLYDRFSGHPLLALSLIGSAVCLAVAPLTASIWLVSGVFALLGLTSASINVGGNALIVLVHGERVRPFMSTMHFAFGVGGLLSPILVAYFEDRPHSLQLTYLVLGLLCLPVAGLIVFSSSPSVQRHHAKAAAPRAPGALLWLLVVFFFLEVGAESSLMGWLFTYATGRGIGNQTAAYLTSAFWAAFTLGRLVTIGFALRFSALPIVLTHLCAWLMIALAMLIAPTSPAILWLGAIAMGLTMAPVFPSTFGFAQRTLSLTGKVTGLFLVGSSAGGMFWPWLVGQFFKSSGPQVMIWVVVFDVIGALGVLAAIVSQSSRHQKEEALSAKLITRNS